MDDEPRRNGSVHCPRGCGRCTRGTLPSAALAVYSAPFKGGGEHIIVGDFVRICPMPNHAHDASDLCTRRRVRRGRIDVRLQPLDPSMSSACSPACRNRATGSDTVVLRVTYTNKGRRYEPAYF
jgi:hypothetical protein